MSAETTEGAAAGRNIDPSALAASLLDEESKRLAAQDSADVEPEFDDTLLPGVGGTGMPWREVLRKGGPSTLLVLFGLNLVDEFDRAALLVLGPDIQRTFGISDATLAAINGIGAVLIFVGAIPLGVLADRHRRTTLVGITSVVWAVFAALGGLTRSAFQLACTRVLNGLGKGNTPVHSSLLADAYPIEGRARVFAFYNSANGWGTAIGPFLAGVIAAAAGGTEGWRAALAVLSVPCLILAVLSFLLREPVRGANEQQAVLGSVEGEGETHARISLSLAFQRLRKIETFRFLMAGLGVLGFALFGAPSVFNLFLERHYDLDALDRGTVNALIALGAVVGFPLGGRYSDRLFRVGPHLVLMLLGGAVAVFGLLYPIALFLPSLPAMVVGMAIANAMVSAATVSGSALVAALVPYRLRGIGFAVTGIYMVLCGGFLGGVLTGAISDALGERTALALVVPPACVISGLLMAYAARFVRADVARTAQDVRIAAKEREERLALVDQGRTPPILQVRRLDFSYGKVQVLFGVDVDVHEGELLALLGTNGAGKSTLLRAISGLAVADRGTIRLAGKDVTLATPAERARVGIVQARGGNGIFPGLTVQDNLLAGAHVYGWDTDRIQARITEVLELFPRLAERLDQKAGLMSGGEQQMLVIAKALLLEPRVLLIDELSLGLAPIVVQDLLAVLERLKQRGVTIVLVEQSLNVALSIADRAVFMEKGRVQFEGTGADLLARDDLVRAVFLGRHATRSPKGSR